MFNYRLANDLDIEDLLDMLRLFHARSPYCNIPWQSDTASEYLFNLMDNGLLVIAEDEHGYPVGCVGFEYGSIPFNVNYYVYVEKFFYVREADRNKKVGAEMLAWAENWIEEAQCASAIVMATLSTSPAYVGQYYAQRGYKLVEAGYMKEVD